MPVDHLDTRQGPGEINAFYFRQLSKLEIAGAGTPLGYKGNIWPETYIIII
jgi:hypothetical protein